MGQPEHLLPQLIPQRIGAVVNRLAKLVWEGREPVEVAGGPVRDDPVPLDRARAQAYKPVRPGEHFGGPGNTWQQRWFRARVGRATRAQRGRRALFWDVQGETTAWIDGAPWAGLDVAHPYCVLPDKACELWLDTGTYQTGIWLNTPRRRVSELGCRFDGAWIACRHEGFWQAYHDMLCLWELLQELLERDGWQAPGTAGHKPPLDRASVLARRLLRDLNACCDAFETRGLDALLAGLSEVYARYRGSAWQGHAALCAHAHLDLVWLWPEFVTRRKGVHSAATALRLMDRYPEMRFIQSQPALYEAIREHAPALHAQIRKRIRSGQWEATGGLEVESDVNIPCGEALARALVLGQHRFAALRDGDMSRTVWLPDVFGYSNCLPQIMKLGGIDSFFTTKLRWSAVTRFPHTLFRWRGPDGSEVLAHLCPASYNGKVQLGDLRSAMDANRQSGVYDHALLPTGFGDGGGGPTEEMCERARRFADLAGAPKTRWTGVEEFFDGVRAHAAQLPVFEGELYLEFHRGTYTTQSELKRRYRAAETALQAHEAARVARGGGPLDQADWLRVAFAQFHDALPGSSIGRVYEDLNAELDTIRERRIEAACRELRAEDDEEGVAVFNPLALPRRAVVALSPAQVGRRAARKRAVQAEDGTPVPLQRVGAGRSAQYLAQVELGPLEGRRITRAPAEPPAVDLAACASEGVLENGLVRARFTETGQLIGLCVDGTNLELVEMAGLRLYPDWPASFDAWDVDQHTLRLGSACATPMELRVAESGPVRARLRGESLFGEHSRMQIDYVLEAGSPHLKVELTVDWHEDHRLLKYHLPTAYRGRHARYGAPFGSVERPQVPGRPGDESQWEVCASRWAAVCNDSGTEGLAVVTEAKYGFSCRDGDLGLSLLRAPGQPDPTADRRRHTMRFAVGRYEPHTTRERVSTAAAAEVVYAPVLQAPGGRSSTSPLRLAELGSLVPAWVLPAQNGGGWILRLHETAGESGGALLELARAPGRVTYVDLLEREQGPVQRLDARRFRLEYGPYHILGVKVAPRRAAGRRAARRA